MCGDKERRGREGGIKEKGMKREIKGREGKEMGR